MTISGRLETVGSSEECATMCSLLPAGISVGRFFRKKKKISCLFLFCCLEGLECYRVGRLKTLQTIYILR